MLFFLLKVVFSTQALLASEGIKPEFLDSSPDDFKTALEATSLDYTDWLKNLESQSYTLLCLGETHNSKYRNFYSEHFFSNYKVDSLFLEATQDQVESFQQDLKDGKEHANLLGANILNVLKAALLKNPKLKVIGIEQTKEQKLMAQKELMKTGRTRLTRETFIAQNAYKHMTPGERHVMLYGSLHCSESDLGLGNNTPAFNLLKKVLPKNSTRSVRTFFRRDLVPFTALLSYLNLENKNLAFTSTKNISPKSYKFIWKLKAVFLNYDDVLFIKR